MNLTHVTLHNFATITTDMDAIVTLRTNAHIKRTTQYTEYLLFHFARHASLLREIDSLVTRLNHMPQLPSLQNSERWNTLNAYHFGRDIRAGSYHLGRVIPEIVANDYLVMIANVHSTDCGTSQLYGLLFHYVGESSYVQFPVSPPSKMAQLVDSTDPPLRNCCDETDNWITTLGRT